MRKMTRARYHYAVRYIKRNADVISANRLAEGMVSSKNKSFWNEVRRVKRTQTQLPSSVDNVTGETEICHLFSKKYQTLLNSVSYNMDEMKSILQDIDNDISTSCKQQHCYSNHNVSSSMVKEAIKQLKANKGDGNDGCQSDHFIHGTDKLYDMLSTLLTVMLKHGYAPDSFLLSTIASIPKNKHKSISDSSNYRGIALSSVIGKVLDIAILKNNSAVLSTCELQFGFKSKHSTTHCTFVIDEVAQYYNNNGSDIYIMLLDASQAFDRLNYCKLFRLLRRKGLCPIVSRFLAYSYTKQCVRAKWGKKVSEPFSVSNGVKQGGVLSPVLFTVYMDELICQLRKTGLGCHIGKLFVGACGYADDLTLLAPTKTALNKLLTEAQL